jgi:transcriptional regulator of acetoin/glycerol metabolism
MATTPRASQFGSQGWTASPALRAPAHAAVVQQPARQGVIEQSHLRCAALGLSRIERADYDPLMRGDLMVARERNQRLFTHAAPVMEMLREQIVDTDSMIVLTDAQGTILHSVGDDSFLERAGAVALSPGVNWAEHSKGTNAIGTALFEEVPTLVHADEHFMHANNFLTCSAVPIFDPRGSMLGVLDVSGDQRSYHRHTMGLVRMSARMIENHWLSDDFSDRLRLHFHSRAEFIGTLLEGIVVVGGDGRILGANRSAMDQLEISSAALRMQSLTSLFGTTSAAIHDHFRAPLAPPMPLVLSNGRKFHATARFNWPSVHALARVRADAEPGEVIEADANAALRDGASTVPQQPLPRPAPLAPAADRASGLNYLRTGDAQIETVLTKVSRILDRGIPLLIMGDTGTGKELLARAVHHDSNRSKQPFVAVNCASIPESLIEAELFGYEEGAFTGARRKGATGRIVQAHGGTLFLDEIGDMPLSLQARLLRVLQERSVTPLGSAKSIEVDITVISATHRPLREMIEQHQFREDLYYRLNGLAVRLPALRERSDLAVLARRMLLAEGVQPTPDISAAVMQHFQHYHWPGNLRQLANVLRTAALMSAGESQITEAHLSDDFLEDVRHAAQQRLGAQPAAGSPSHGLASPQRAAAYGQIAPNACAQQAPQPAAEAAPPRTLEEAEIDMIRRVLAEVQGNISEASKRLGISRNTIYRKLRWNQKG